MRVLTTGQPTAAIAIAYDENNDRFTQFPAPLHLEIRQIMRMTLTH